jgi:hypothetical protein
LRPVNHLIAWVLSLSAFLGWPAPAMADAAPPTAKTHLLAAFQNIMALQRPGQQGFAAAWDGNKYVQCGLEEDKSLRCEAAGSLMQPSLERVLAPDRVARLTVLGWRLDPSFGNYVQTFPPGTPNDQVADKILQALTEGYDADLAGLQVESTWVAREPCPPRNGPSQNLAGLINDAPAMARTAIHGCAFHPVPATGPGLSVGSTAELITLYGARVTGEIQRLRVNAERRVHVIFEAGIGYVQCKPEAPPPAIYCEAESAESWPALASVLTPDRVARLASAGYAQPGRAPNYWKIYPLGRFDDAAIAREVLGILRDVYGYTGAPQLEILTEEPRPR